ncbi:two component transcriptional regulator, LuxR family [Corynebacterium epidermidicanis]|uniref:Two component transcriptional regulator, LuxR family n=2 Tax=Corynebacterium epidermidicanis TaxID=1050174 RepID=A0A0G3GZB0_9CORY|nr:two component transcriptional regulator, LuxR family [Corynebacterium epidermidicanis]
MMPNRILLVDDDPTVLEGFPIYLSTTDDLQIVATATTGKIAVEWLNAHSCDLVLSDIHMPDMNGIELLHCVQRLNSPPLFVAMTAYDTDETMVQALRLGAVGYIIKGETPNAIIFSLRDALNGGTSISPDCLQRLLPDTPSTNKSFEEVHKFLNLTSREQAVITLLCEGNTNIQIAHKLNFAEITIRKTISSLFAKYGVSNRVELVVKHLSYT